MPKNEGGKDKTMLKRVLVILGLEKNNQPVPEPDVVSIQEVAVSV